MGGTKQRSVFGVARQLLWRAFLDPTMRREVRVDETGALKRWRQVAAWMSHLPSSANCEHAPEIAENWKKETSPTLRHQAVIAKRSRGSCGEEDPTTMTNDG